MDHLCCPIKEDDTDYRIKLDAWSKKADEMLAELLALMSARLGYDFDKVKIKKGIYSPRGHGEIEIDNMIIRKGMVAIMTRKAGFPVSPFNDSNDSSGKV